jgi:transposase
MRQKSVKLKEPAEKVVKDIRRATRKRHSSEEKIRIVLEGLRGEDSIAELCRREGINQNLHFLQHGPDRHWRRLCSDAIGQEIGRWL